MGLCHRMCGQESVTALFLISMLPPCSQPSGEDARDWPGGKIIDSLVQSTARLERKILEGNGLFADHACQSCILTL